MVIETGLRKEIPAIESSRLWEDALLSVFFDAGHVISNTPIYRIPERPQKNLPDEARLSLGEALEGGAEFFILALLDYQNQSRTGGALLKPHTISLRLFKTEPCHFLFSQEYTASDLGEGRATNKDEITNARNAARAIASHIHDAPHL
jgi:hypothetical protein